jgi:hypothetical protein
MWPSGMSERMGVVLDMTFISAGKESYNAYSIKEVKK